MPRGDIRLRNGTSIEYDDVRRSGDDVVFKTAHSHNVQRVHVSDVAAIEENERHRTIFGRCESLSDSEVRSATRRHGW